MKVIVPKILLVLSLILSTYPVMGQDCSAVDLEIPLPLTFLCYDAEHDFGPYAIPPGGTFSGPGMQANGLFNAVDAVLPPGSTAIDETITITYSVVQPPGGNCTVTQDVFISVPVFAQIDPIPTVFCEDDSQIPLSASPGLGTAFAGLFVNGDPPGPSGTNEFFPAFYGPGEHVITFNYLDQDAGCFSRDTIIVNVFSETDLQALIKVSDDVIPSVMCPGDAPIVFNPSPADGVLSGPGIVGNTFDPAIAGMGDHIITYEFSTPTGSCMVSTDVQISVKEVIASFDVMSSTCADQVDIITYTGTPNDGTLTLDWTVIGGVIQNDDGNSIQVLADGPGLYDVELLVTGELPCLEATAIEQVDKSGFVEVTTIDDQLVGLDAADILFVTNATTTNTGGITYEWTPPGELSCDDCQEPSLVPNILSGPQTYTVVATDDFGCSATDEVEISFSFEKKIFVPNAFTPNGDGKNDFLYLYGQGIEQLEFSLFDRWGERVFYTNDPTLGWDGSFANEPLNTAVFFYVLDVTYVDGDRKMSKGDVTLIR